jgi:hypothetical protein
MHRNFSLIVVATFKEFIHKFLEVYLDDLDNVQFAKGAHAIPSLDAGSMSSAPNFSKFEEVHILYTFWHTIGACSLQGWIASRPS